MSGDSFIDPNIWLYTFMDESSPKHALAQTLIERNSVVLSTQVVNEVCNNLIRKAGYTEPEIQQTIQNLAAVYPILDVTLPNYPPGFCAARSVSPVVLGQPYPCYSARCGLFGRLFRRHAGRFENRRIDPP